jgi:hypothetical protein
MISIIFFVMKPGEMVEQGKKVLQLSFGEKALAKLRLKKLSSEPRTRFMCTKSRESWADPH